MSLALRRRASDVRQAVVWLSLAMLALVAGVVSWYSITLQHQNEIKTHRYTISQDIVTQVMYRDNQFFTSQVRNEQGYVASLTEAVVADYSYDVKAPEASQLHTEVSMVAEVRASHPMPQTEKPATLWSRQFVLLPIQQGGKTVRYSVSLPYREYNSMINELRQSLTLGVAAEVELRISSRLIGQIDGAPVDDLQTTKLVLSLAQQVFAIKPEFKKTITNTITSGEAGQWLLWQKIILYGFAGLATVALVLAGLYLLRYRRGGLRKSPYQRELDKIYRYHDGLIIHAARPINMVGKKVVTLQSFDDILNLEEELKVPIIASRIGSTATRFVILHENTVYNYVLGEQE